MEHVKKMVGFGSIVQNVIALGTQSAAQMVLASNARISLLAKIVKDVR